jgi:hypothetical protein
MFNIHSELQPATTNDWVKDLWLQIQEEHKPLEATVASLKIQDNSDTFSTSGGNGPHMGFALGSRRVSRRRRNMEQDQYF